MIHRNLAFAALTLLSLAGCGSFQCSDQGTCKNDTAPATSDIAACQKAIDDGTCGAKAKALFACAHDNEQCDASGNRDDLSTIGRCTRPLADLQSCCTSNPASAACTGS